MTVDIDPIVTRIGPFLIGWEGIFIGLALLVGVLVAAKDVCLAGLDPDLVYGAASWALPAGLIGSRALHVVDSWTFYAVHPFDTFAIGQGGAAAYGAIIFGSVAALLFARRQHVESGRLFDACSPALALGLAVGRIGELLTGAELGRSTNLPLAIRYVNPSSFDSRGLSVHPVAAYDIIWALGLYVLLARLRSAHPGSGTVYWAFTGLYATGQVWIGFFRATPPDAFGLGQAQLIGLAFIALSVGTLAAMAAKAGGFAHREGTKSEKKAEEA